MKCSLTVAPPAADGETERAEEAVRRFREFTGDPDEGHARRLLAICGWDLEQAVNVFFMRRSASAAVEEREAEKGGAGNPDSNSGNPNSNRGSQSSNIASGSNGIGQESSSSFSSTSFRRRPSELVPLPKTDSDDLATIYKQMVEENELNEVLEKNRRWIESRRRGSEGTVLLEQNFHDTYRSIADRPHDPVFEQFPSSITAAIEQFEQAREAHRAGLRPRTLPDLGSEIVVDGVVRSMPPSSSASISSNSAPSESSSRSGDLRTLFRPPVELMFRGDWDQALELARNRGLWLLVNIQNALEFASAKLNRDIWSDETVRELISTNFLLWQVYHDSADGARVRAYYGLDPDGPFPVLFLVDPRTGEQVQALRAPDAVFFLDQLTEFLARNPTFRARDRQFRELKEEQTENTELEPSLSNGLDLNGNPGGGELHQQQTPKVDPEEWRKWTVDEEAEQASGPSSVRLALRMPDGQTRRLRMWRAAPISALFSLILSHGFEPAEHQLVLDYPRREHRLTPGNRLTPMGEVMGLRDGQDEVVHVDRIEERDQ